MPNKSSKPIRLAALFSHPIQYFSPIFKKIASDPNINLTVYYCSQQGIKEYIDPGFGKKLQWDIPLLDGYQHKFLINLVKDKPVTGFFSLINPQIITELLQKPYDAIIIHGYDYFTDWLGFLAAKFMGIKIFLHGDSNLVDQRSFIKNISKQATLRPLMKLVDTALYVGTNNKNYYIHYGISEKQCYFTPNIVDNEFFNEKYEKLLNQKNILRSSLGVVDDRPILLFVGKLTPKKQPLNLLAAFSQLRQNYECALVFAGDGPLRSEIEAMVKMQSIPDVYLTGFINQSEISNMYIAGDILILPSAYTETWGLVVNEAMNFGLPVIVTDRVGCAPDLVEENKNGFVVPHDSIEALRDALEVLIANKDKRLSFGKRSKEIIQTWGMDQVLQGINSALNKKE